VRSLSTNPILPGSLFTAIKEKLETGLQIDIAHANKFISFLENAVISNHFSTGTPTSVRYENNRKSILSRRIQLFFKHYSR
jgi:hypothetical protein